MPISDVPAPSETLTWIDYAAQEFGPTEELVLDTRWGTYLALHQARAERAADGTATEVLGGQNANTGKWQVSGAPQLFSAPGSPDWTEHVAEDASAAAEFYTSVFETAAA